MTRGTKVLGSPSLRALFVLLQISLIHADSSVYILSNDRQRVTSSILNWLPSAHYETSKEIVIGGFEIQHEVDDNQAESSVIKERSLYVCCVFHNGVWVAGKQIEGEKKCTVTYLGNVASYERYDLLENVDNSARLHWVAWDKFNQIPVGAVATDDSVYVARRASSKSEKNDLANKNLVYTHYIGTYDKSESLGRITYVKEDGKEGTAETGDILVETEPIFYELEFVRFAHDGMRVIKRVPLLLRESTMSNVGTEASVFTETLYYTFNHSIHWGHGHVMIKGLNTSITLAKGTKLDYISWGIENKSVRLNATTVKIRLEPGTAVKVTIHGNYTDMEVPYTGELVSVYDDGESRSRTIGAVCREETMMDVIHEFGPIYYLSNMTIVPTTQPPVVISTVIDENEIVPTRKTDLSDVRNEDDGPLSLRTEFESTMAASTSLKFNKSSLAIITLSVIAFYRIT